MKQLIYTCPIAVMWMMKHHGIRFRVFRDVIKYGQAGFFEVTKENFLTFCSYNDSNIFCDENPWRNLFEVHPDDVDKYEPRKGDYADYNEYGGIVSFQKDSYGECVALLGCSFCGLTKEEFLNSKEVKILMRDGKPWINPCEIRGEA